MDPTHLGGANSEGFVDDNIDKNNKTVSGEASGASQVALVGSPRSRIAVYVRIFFGGIQ